MVVVHAVVAAVVAVVAAVAFVVVDVDAVVAVGIWWLVAVKDVMRMLVLNGQC